MVVSQKKVVNFSWPRKWPPPWQFPGYATARLDRFYVNNRMVGKVKLGACLDVPNTDHRAVTVMYKKFGTNQGTGYWKCNAAVLVDQYLKEDLKCLCDRMTAKRL
jgi:hypothetical protein